MNNYQNHPLAGAVDLDSAMTKLWSFYKKYFVGLYLISVIMGLLSSVLTSGIDIATLQSTTDPAEMLEMLKGMAGPYLLIILVSLVVGVLLHTWTLEKPAEDPGFVSSLLKMSLMALIPYMVTIIIFTLIAVVLTTVGLILLVLPGLFAIFYISTVMIFAMPVTLIETRNPYTIISRSFALAHKNLWPNMGWVAVTILLLVVISLVLGALIMLPFTGSFIRSITSSGEVSSMLEISRNPIYIIFSALTSSLITPVLPILAFIIYFRNRGDEAAEVIATENDASVKVEDLYPRMPEEK
ncbi:MAG: hypothetical protein RBT02_10470 [Bacteroidales bacterium]|jgi:hypothetical protein|nr:hypothetical protein [Bacteroidales bacterium]